MRIVVSVFYLIIAVWGSACSTILQEPPETSQTISSVLPPQPEEPKTVRSLGSLWTSSSAWNHLYTANASRTEGDLLEIQLTGAVKNRIEGLRKRLLKEKYGDEDYQPVKKVDSGVIAGDGPAEPTKKMVVEPLPNSMQAVIKDVGQRGLYKVTAVETVKVGEEETRLYVEGLVRDRDIDADDKFSADSIYGMKIELRPRSAAAAAATAESQKVATGGPNVSW